MAVTRDVVVRFSADVRECEAALERCVALAERFNELWGDAPRPDGIERVEYQPGDTVVLRYDDVVTEEEVVAVRRQWEAVFPGVLVAVLSGGLRIETVLGAAA